MKKIGLLFTVLLLTFALTACSTEVKTYSFGPQVDQTKITDEYRAFLQDKLEHVGKIDKGLIYKCYSAKYDDEGGLTLDGFFINNTGFTVSDIEGLIIVDAPTQYNTMLEVARGKFTFSVESFGVLENRTARPWQLTFSDNLVTNPNKSATDYTITTNLSYKKQ